MLDKRQSVDLQRSSFSNSAGEYQWFHTYNIHAAFTQVWGTGIKQIVRRFFERVYVYWNLHERLRIKPVAL